jgi:hypothetical protein
MGITMPHDARKPLDSSKAVDSAEREAVSSTGAETAGSSRVETAGLDTAVAVGAFEVGRLLNVLAFSLITTWLDPRRRSADETSDRSCASVSGHK